MKISEMKNPKEAAINAVCTGAETPQEGFDCSNPTRPQLMAARPWRKGSRGAAWDDDAPAFLKVQKTETLAVKLRKVNGGQTEFGINERLENNFQVLLSN